MKTIFFSTLILLLGFFAQSAEQRTLNGVISNKLTLPTEFRNLSIELISITEVPTKIEIDDSQDYGVDGNSTIVLETAKVVQVRLRYEDLSFNSDDYTHYSEVNLPLSLFSEAEINKIQKASNFNFDLTGKKTRHLIQLANQLVKVEVFSKKVPVTVIDYDKTECEYTSELQFQDCKNPVYKTVLVNKITAILSHK